MYDSIRWTRWERCYHPSEKKGEESCTIWLTQEGRKRGNWLYESAGWCTRCAALLRITLGEQCQEDVLTCISHRMRITNRCAVLYMQLNTDPANHYSLTLAITCALFLYVCRENYTLLLHIGIYVAGFKKCI